MDAHKGYEAQIAKLHEELEDREKKILHLMEDKQSFHGELSAVREFCVKLENMKDSLSRQLAEKEALSAQVVIRFLPFFKEHK